MNILLIHLIRCGVKKRWWFWMERTTRERIVSGQLETSNDNLTMKNGFSGTMRITFCFPGIPKMSLTKLQLRHELSFYNLWLWAQLRITYLLISEQVLERIGEIFEVFFLLTVNNCGFMLLCTTRKVFNF